MREKDLKEDRIVLRVIAYMSFITSGILFYFWAKGNFEFTNPFFHFAIFTRIKITYFNEKNFI